MTEKSKVELLDILESCMYNLKMDRAARDLDMRILKKQYEENKK